MRLLYSLQDLDPVHLGHHDVEDHDIEGLFVDLLERLDAALHRVHLELIVSQHSTAAAEDDVLVVDAKNSPLHERLPVSAPCSTSAPASSGR